MLETGLAIVVKTALYGLVLSTAGLRLSRTTLGIREDASKSKVERAAGLATILAAAISLLLLFLRLGGGFDRATLGAVLGEPVGTSLILQFAAASVLVFGPSTRWLRLPAAIILASAFGLTGHAPAESPWLGLVVAIHTLLAAWWLGSLWLMNGRRNGSQIRDDVDRFSRLALFAVAGLLTAGFTLAVVLVGLDPDFDSGYMRWLLLKLALVCAVLFIATYNRLVLSTRLKTDKKACGLFVGMVRSEIAILLAICAAVACMTTIAMPEHRATPASPVAPPVRVGDLVVSRYMMRATLGNVPTSAVYLDIENTGDAPDRLISAQCACAARATLHLMRMDGDMMVMASIDDGIALPAHSRLRLAPMGSHIMLEQTNHALVDGGGEALSLHFQRAGTLTLRVPVVQDPGSDR